MRTATMVLVLLSGCGGMGAPHNDGGALVWWQNCGPPSCSGGAGVPDSGLPYCPVQQAGMPCSVAGVECDPYLPCTGHLLCATSDPKMQPGGCPVSRAKYKKEIRFLEESELRAVSRELLELPLATFKYREGDGRTRLGFVIDGHESLACVEGDHVDLYGYTSMAVAALQVQQRQIAELRRELATLRKELGRRRR